MKVLCLDIETSPNIAHVWGLWKQTVALNQLMETGQVICWGAKWLGEDDMMFSSVHQDTRRAMIKRIHMLLDEADVVIHYNGAKFDIPTLNVEFVKLGLLPPATYKQLDLFQVVKANFRFPSLKLEHVAREFKIGQKKKHEGHELWVKCMAGDPKAWQDMEDYNEQDVRILENLYNVLLPWAKPALNLGVFTDTDSPVCPNCGGNVTRRGFAFTALSKFQRYQCTTCGAWSRGRENLKDRTNVTVPIAS